ncbi:MAG TPA: nuclear transport factor 2 family protein [Rhizomicrobium sp.]|nr:nuclear transport factor 2 family protein [Rhizomicrobium sp.]
MTASDVEVIRGIYDAFARADIGAVLGAMAPDIVWREADNHPYADGNPYVGPDAVLQGVFARLGTEWDGFAVSVDEFVGAHDKVVAIGRYTGTNRRTGKRLNAQVVHVWTVDNGKAAGFQQYTDTHQFVRTMEA